MAGLEQRNGLQNVGQFLGFIISYILFTTMLFWIFRLKGSSMLYFHAIGITMAITAVGFLLRRWLK